MKSIVTSSLIGKEKTHKRKYESYGHDYRGEGVTFLKPNVLNVREKVWEKEKKTKWPNRK